MLEKKLYLGLTILLSAVMGCSNNESSTVSTGNGAQKNQQSSAESAAAFKQSTPQEVFETFSSLMKQNNWPKAARCLTEESQASACGAMIFISSMMCAFDPEKKEKFEEILKKHELDLKKQTPPLATETDSPFELIGRSIRNKPGFLSDIGNWLVKSSGEDSGFSLSDQASELKDVKIEGDKATAIVVMDGKEKPLEFVKQDGKWLIHIPKEVFEFGKPITETAEMKLGGNSSFSSGKMFDDFDFGFDEQEDLPAYDALSLKQYHAAWQIDLDVKDQPAGEVIKKIAADGGLVIFKPENLKDLFEKKITIKLEKVSVVQALEQIAAQLNYYPRYRLKTVTFNAGKRTFPVLFTGPFAIIVKKVDVYVPYAAGSVRLQFFAAGMPTAAIAPFKKVVLSHNKARPGETSWQLKVATGTQGKNILVPSDSDSYSYTSAQVTKKTILLGRSISLMNLLKSVSEIERIEGSLSFFIPTKIETLLFDKLEKGNTAEQGKIKLKLKRIQLGEKSSSIAFDFEGANSNQMTVIGFDANDKVIELRGSGGYAQNGKGEKSVFFGGKPVKIKVLLTSETEKLSYPVLFENIALQHSQEMPNAIPKFEFSGKAPVQIKFLKFAEKNKQKVMLFEVKNQSNRDIRSLSFFMDFLDAGGKKLKDFPHSHSGNRNMFPVGKTVEISVSTFAMPEETKTVSPRHWIIHFADNSKWEDKQK